MYKKSKRETKNEPSFPEGWTVFNATNLERDQWEYLHNTRIIWPVSISKKKYWERYVENYNNTRYSFSSISSLSRKKYTEKETSREC